MKKVDRLSRLLQNIHQRCYVTQYTNSLHGLTRYPQVHNAQIQEEPTKERSHSNNSAPKRSAPFILLTASALLATKNNSDASDAASEELSRLVLHDNKVDIVKVRKLLMAGADPNYRYDGGWCLIHVAVARGNVALAKLLLRFSGDVNVAELFYNPRAVGAVSFVELENVKSQRLCMNKNFKNNVDWSGFTPLHYAVLNDDVTMTEVLLKHDASVGARTDSGFLAMDLAADKGIKRLLEEALENEKKKKIMSLGPFLRNKVIGQEQALSEVTAAVQRRDLGWQDDKPLVMLFVGSSGIGKTETAKQLAAHKNSGSPDSNTNNNNNSKVSFIRMDMSEFQERHEVSKFIGSPPGYIGHDEGGQLTRALAAHPESVVLFDEVEKAHPDVLNIMLQLFDEGRLTDGKGKTIVCPNAIFVMTTNVGADQIATTTTRIDEVFKKVIMYPLLKHAFQRNEFLGRINEIVYFLPFTADQCVKLVERELGKVQEHTAKLNIAFSWSDDAARHLSAAIDKNYGARSLKNEVSRNVVNKLASMNLEGRIRSGSKVQLAVVNEQIVFDVS